MGAEERLGRFGRSQLKRQNQAEHGSEEGLQTPVTMSGQRQYIWLMPRLADRPRQAPRIRGC
jgi:hypothetical protein